MIEEFDNPYISYDGAYSGPTREEIIEKINEIIRYLNEKEDGK